jgi:hypothetical protein
MNEIPKDRLDDQWQFGLGDDLTFSELMKAISRELGCPMMKLRTAY